MAAILFPVFARAREKARETSCLSNVKEITLALIMYKDDYDGTFPLDRFDNPRVYWCAAVNPYIGQQEISGWTGSNYGIWQCPSFHGEPAWYGGAYSDYGLNYHIDGHNEAEYDFPAQTPVIAENFYSHSNGNDYGWYRWYGINHSRTRFDHNERGNFGFMDGHAKGNTRTGMMSGDYYDYCGYYPPS